MQCIRYVTAFLEKRQWVYFIFSIRLTFFNTHSLLPEVPVPLASFKNPPLPEIPDAFTYFFCFTRIRLLCFQPEDQWSSWPSKMSFPSSASWNSWPSLVLNFEVSETLTLSYLSYRALPEKEVCMSLGPTLNEAWHGRDVDYVITIYKAIFSRCGRQVVL